MHRFQGRRISSPGRTLAVSVAALFLLAGTALAAPLGLGAAQATGTILINSDGIFFSNVTNIGPDTGSLAGTTSIIQNNLPGPSAPAYYIPNWIILNGPASGPIGYTLVFMNPGFGTLGPCFENVPYTSCTPSAASPLSLVQFPDNQVLLTFNGGGGFAYDATGGVARFFITITSQNNIPGTMTDILAAIYSPAGFTTSVSITYQTTSELPEPLTFTMMGVGLVGLCLLFRQRKRSENGKVR